MAQYLNDQTAKRLECPESKHHVIFWDAKLKGFGLRVTAKGARAWVADYRCKGKQRRKTIGSIELWGCGAARDEARNILRDASRGIDAMDQCNTELSVYDLWRKYETEILPQRPPKQQLDVRTYWNKDILPAIGNKPIRNVTFEDVDKLHKKITDSGRLVKANRTIQNLCRVFNLAIRWRLAEKNPTTGFKRNPEHNRERYLTIDEFNRLHKALNKCHNQTSAQAIQALMLSGARKSEVLNMRWDQVDLDNGIWLKPPNTTKQRRTHRVVLNDAAIALLKRRQRKSTSEWIFPGRTGKPITDVFKTFAAACKEAALVDRKNKPTLRLHDLRHSFASVLVSEGASLPMIGALLGHSSPATTNRYAHLFDDVQRDVANKVGAIIE